MRTTLAAALTTALLLGSLLLAQGTTPPPLTLITAQGRRPLPTTMIRGQEMVATDDLVSLLQVAAREDTTAGGIALSYKGKTVVVSPDQPMVSVAGRLVPLQSPAIRNGRRWFVSLDFLPRGLSPIYDARIELRRPSRLVIVGDLRVPRVTVRLDSAGPPTRLSIEASPSTLITPMVESGRIVLRLEADALDVAPLPQAGGLLEQARTEGTTVVLTLSPRAGLARAAQASGTDVSRLNFDVPLAGQTDSAATPAGALPAGVTPPTTTEAPQLPPSPSGARLIVLDPGHGGADTGATGPSGVQEKALTLEIARRVKTLLESRLGMRVLLTRDDDRNVSLDERTAVANNNKANLFVSLHLNTSPSPLMSGAEIYQLRLERETPGRRGTASEPFTLPLTTGGTRTVALVPWNLAQARHREDSTLLANLLESSLRAQVPMGLRPIQEAPMRVLAGLDMAAVVVELAYLSNPEQDTASQSDDFQNKAAQAILEAVSAYRAAWRGGQ
ncbi:MAG: N-acetylmuramoyl-L-alanine amidase [Vicinamibacterales bacterium]